MIRNEGVLCSGGNWLSDREAGDYITRSILDRETRAYEDKLSRIRRGAALCWVGYGVSVAAGTALTLATRNATTLLASIVVCAIVGAIHLRLGRKRRGLSPVARVGSIRKVCLPIRLVHVAGRTVAVDLSGSAPATSFSYPQLPDPQRMRDIWNEFGSLREALEAPLLTNRARVSIGDDDSHQVFAYGAEKRALELVAELASMLARPTQGELAVPVIQPDSAVLRFLTRHGVPGTPAPDTMMLYLLDDRAIEAQFAGTEGVLAREAATGASRAAGDVVAAFLAECRKLLGRRTRDSGSALDALGDYRANIRMHAMNSAFVYFCPTCNSDFFAQQDFASFAFGLNSRMAYDYARQTWECPVCGGASDLPIAVPRTYWELIFPMVKLLLAENRLAREQIYNDIADQKRLYVDRAEREIRGVEQDTRKELDAISATIARLKANLAGERQALATISSVMASCATRHQGRLERIRASSRETISRIDESAGRNVADFRKDIDTSMARARSEFEQQARMARVAEERRDEQLMAIASNLERVDATMKASAVTSRRSERHLRTIAAIQFAEANKRGDLDRNPLLHPVYTAKKTLNGVINSLAGGSAFDGADESLPK